MAQLKVKVSVLLWELQSVTVYEASKGKTTHG